jgi:hypothetical protein
VAALTAATAAPDIEVDALADGEVSVVVVGVADEDVALVVIDRGFEVAFVVVIETWAVAAKPVGEVAGDGELDEALKVGFVWARKAARKLAKKGLLVGIAADDLRRIRDFKRVGVRRTPIDGV